MLAEIGAASHVGSYYFAIPERAIDAQIRLSQLQHVVSCDLAKSGVMHASVFAVFVNHQHGARFRV